jgi:hypothetical protein
MSTEYQKEQAERRETLQNDARVRQQQQGTTFSQFAQDEANEIGGRFGAHEKSVVVGSAPAPDYPPGPTWCAGDQGVEPALGYAINDAPVVGELHEVEKSLRELGMTGIRAGQPDGGEVEAPSSQPQLDVEPASPLPNKPDDNEPPEAA